MARGRRETQLSVDDYPPKGKSEGGSRIRRALRGWLAKAPAITKWTVATVIGAALSTIIGLVIVPIFQRAHDNINQPFDVVTGALNDYSSNGFPMFVANASELDNRVKGLEGCDALWKAGVDSGGLLLGRRILFHGTAVAGATTL